MKVSKNTRFGTVCTTTSKHVDRSQRREQHANLAGLEHIYLEGQGASTIQVKKRIQEYLNGQNQESFDESIIFMSMFNDTEWTQKGNTEKCLHTATEVAAFATNLKPGHLCFLNGNSIERQGKCDIVALVMFPTRHLQRQSHYRLNS